MSPLRRGSSLHSYYEGITDHGDVTSPGGSLRADGFAVEKTQAVGPRYGPEIETVRPGYLLYIVKPPRERSAWAHSSAWTAPSAGSGFLRQSESPVHLGRSTRRSSRLLAIGYWWGGRDWGNASELGAGRSLEMVPQASNSCCRRGWCWCLRAYKNIDHVRMYAGVQIVNLDDEGRRFGCPGYESSDVISPIHR